MRAFGAFLLAWLVACGSAGARATPSNGGPEAEGDARVPEADAGPDALPPTLDAPREVVVAPVEVNVAVTTLAGSGMGTFADGSGRDASFFHPSGVAVDASGNVYVADKYNHRIRKVTPLGAVTTLAGSGDPAWSDGAGAAASFTFPAALALDADGTLVVGDKHTRRIRRVTPAGLVTTIAGSGDAAVVDGPQANASFTSPIGIAIDRSRNVYIADVGTAEVDNNRIRRLSAGIVAPLAGAAAAGYADGTGDAARFDYPVGLAVTSSGDVLVADSNNHRIRRVTAAGATSTLAGSGIAGFADGDAATAKLYGPFGVAVDAADNVYVADFYNHRIRRITVGGMVTTLAGAADAGFVDGDGGTARFDYPFAVAAAAVGDVVVADYENHAIRRVKADGIGVAEVQWTPTPGATGYVVTAKADGRPARTCVTSTARCTLRELTSGIRYEVTVVATADGRTSTSSDPIGAIAE